MSRRSIHPLAAAPLRALLQQKAVGGETFTQCGLRDELCAHPELSDFGLQTGSVPSSGVTAGEATAAFADCYAASS